MAYKTHKGKFKPFHPEKYLGDPSNIVYRSRWELKFMGYLDAHPNVIKWSSEELAIPYKSPIDNKIHRYFPDFVIKKRTPEGLIETTVVEIKPKVQCAPPKVQTKATRKYITEVQTWGINSAKWAACSNYCKERKWKFEIITEVELGIAR
jgi:hypothetical protein